MEFLSAKLKEALSYKYHLTSYIIRDPFSPTNTSPWLGKTENENGVALLVFQWVSYLAS